MCTAIRAGRVAQHNSPRALSHLLVAGVNLSLPLGTEREVRRGPYTIWRSCRQGWACLDIGTAIEHLDSSAGELDAFEWRAPRRSVAVLMSSAVRWGGMDAAAWSWRRASMVSIEDMQDTDVVVE